MLLSLLLFIFYQKKKNIYMQGFFKIIIYQLYKVPSVHCIIHKLYYLNIIYNNFL